jgi:hypothetical protein
LLEEYKKYNKYADNKQLTWYRNWCWLQASYYLYFLILILNYVAFLTTWATILPPTGHGKGVEVVSETW